MAETRTRKKVASPGSIANREHLDGPGCGKETDGSARPIGFIADPTLDGNVLEDDSVLRVANTTGALAFIWIGPASLAPVAVDATNGLAMPADHVERFYVGLAADVKDRHVVKTSAAMQVAILDN